MPRLDLADVPLGRVQTAVDEHTDAADRRAAQSLATISDLTAELDTAVGQVRALSDQLAALESPLLDVDPARFPPGPQTPATWKAQTGALVSAQEAARVTRLVDPLGRHVLRHRLLANKIGSDGGFAFMIPLPRPVDAARFELRGRFVAGFDWALGGKLPGMSGVAPGVSSTWPSGGRLAGDDGFSVRHMWERAGVGTDYVYGKDQRGMYGDGLKWAKPLAIDVDFVIVDEVRLNTADQADGTITTWLNGEKVLTATRRFRSRPEVQIGHVMWSMFRGGDQTWASKVDGYIDVHRCTVQRLP